MSKKGRKIGQCVYCGETKLLTRDHVISKCLFPAPLPSFMVTVPACDACNSEKAKHDDYLRDMLVMDASASKSQAAQEILTGKVFRAADRNQSLAMRAAKSKGKIEPIYSPGGIYLGQGFSFPLEAERINRVFLLIVRGLYYKIRKQRLPDDCEFEVRRVFDFSEVWERLQQIGYNAYKLGDGVFTCIFIYAAEEPFLTQWWLWFYESICIHVSTTPANFDAESLLSAAIV
jgi:hypothetical protein